MGDFSKRLGRRLRGKEIDLMPFNRDGLFSGYEIKPGKGKRDGNCNRTACQVPLEGHQQWTMRDHETNVEGKRLYYCGECASMFNAFDLSQGYEPRCRLEVNPYACDEVAGTETEQETVGC